MGLREDLAEDRVGELTLREAIKLPPATPLRDAIELMRSKALGCAVIVDEHQSAVGLLTEHSLLDALIAGESLESRTIDEFRDPAFLVVSTSDSVSQVWDAVRTSGTRFICVVDDDGNLVGVTGHRGIAEYLAEYFPRQTIVQRLDSTPWMQQREGA